jgi:hypothetical protein
VVVGDGGREAYTTILWGGLLSRESQKLAEAEAVSNVEGNMCGPAMRGADALPWSKTPSRRKGPCRNLGGPASDRWRYASKVRIGKARSRSR